MLSFEPVTRLELCACQLADPHEGLMRSGGRTEHESEVISSVWLSWKPGSESGSSALCIRTRQSEPPVKMVLTSQQMGTNCLVPSLHCSLPLVTYAPSGEKLRRVMPDRWHGTDETFSARAWAMLCRVRVSLD